VGFKSGGEKMPLQPTSSAHMYCMAFP
jgi:hypothetical protein